MRGAGAKNRNVAPKKKMRRHHLRIILICESRDVEKEKNAARLLPVSHNFYTDKEKMMYTMKSPRSAFAALVAAATILLAPAFAMSIRADNDVKLSECPAAVQKTVTANARDGKVGDVDVIKVEGRTLYVAEVDLAGGRDLKIHVDSEGALIKTREDAALTDAPAAVQEAAKKLVPAGGKVDDVDKEVAGGKTTWHVEIDRPQAKDLKVVFGEDGAVISQRES